MVQSTLLCISEVCSHHVYMVYIPHTNLVPRLSRNVCGKPGYEATLYNIQNNTVEYDTTHKHTSIVSLVNAVHSII